MNEMKGSSGASRYFNLANQDSACSVSAESSRTKDNAPEQQKYVKFLE
jgi:hypothetical protein